jgi:RNA polymerase sigma factor (sigma-70 family)
VCEPDESDPRARSRLRVSRQEIGILMERLEAEDPDAARMVDMHYFSGFTLDEIAREMGLTRKQVRLRWERGMRWLRKTLQSPAPDGGSAFSSHAGI